MPLLRLLVAAALSLGALTACGGDEPPKDAKLPDGVDVRIDQSRIQRNGRTLFLRVHNGTKEPLVVTGYTLTSPRFEDVRWTGSEEVGASYETDLEFEMPEGRCGTDVDATVRLTYRLGDGDLRRSTTAADDPYGNAADFADRDCAEQTLQEAATVEVGTPTVEGSGRTAVLALPVTMTPTGKRRDVRFTGFGNTVLFRQAPGSATDVSIPLGPGDPVARVRMVVVPARCDPHAIAEDKVGRLFPVSVAGDGVSENASFFLPLTKDQKLAFFTYIRATCGLPGD